MDPLGFALENFNAIGKWRTRDGDAAIDPSGTFPDGTRFANPAEFRSVLLSHQDQFVRTFAEKMLTFGLGRGLDYYDMPAVRTILRDSANQDYRWSSVIVNVVKSVPFQMRTANETGGPGEDRWPTLSRRHESHDSFAQTIAASNDPARDGSRDHCRS
jgi:hypothetical protein